jgi:hypothetical protein
MSEIRGLGQAAVGDHPGGGVQDLLVPVLRLLGSRFRHGLDSLNGIQVSGYGTPRFG